MLRIERIRKDIVALSKLAAQANERRQEALALARAWWAEMPAADDLRSRLAPLVTEQAGDSPRWSGGIPVMQGTVQASIPCPEVPLDDLTLIGTDGSQIFPDRHALTLYYLLQVGAVLFRYNGQAPGVEVREWLRCKDEELHDAQGYLIDRDVLGMERTVKEIEVMAELAAAECTRSASLVLGLTDGPLLWPYLDRNPASGEQFHAYLETLRAMHRTGGIPVGYVDRPGGRPLLDLLWASRLPPEELTLRVGETPFSMLDDEVFVVTFLEPGARTTWFSRPTPTNRRHAGVGEEVWFCYLNIGSQARSTIARIEAPAWAVPDSEAMAVLHAALVHQAQVVGGYPYVLARAHEEALVTTHDKAILEQIIQRELFGVGLLAQPSDKARQKLLLGQKR